MAGSYNSKKKKPNEEVDSLAVELGNKPPQAVDVEAAVLGAMLLEPACVDQSMQDLNEGCFYDPRHKLVFKAISKLVLEHASIDIVTVSAKLKNEGLLEEVGGTMMLADLSEKVGSAAHVEYYIKILKQKAIQRDLITASYDILHDAFDDSVNVDVLVDKAQTKVYDAVKNNIRRDVQDIGSIINSAMDEIQKMQGKVGLSGVPSGFKSIDRITMGWQKSDLIILAARPSVGKTAFALNLVRNAAVDAHIPVAFFSLEMSATQLAKRLMTSESGLSADKIKGGAKLEDFEWQQLETKLANLSAAPQYIDDTPGIQIMEFRTKVKNLVKQKQVQLVVVDYLQLIQGPSELRGMREQEVAAISRTLKLTAKELEIPIIALSQLSRNAVQRSGGNGQPQLSDLRESGSIEQDADMVIFIHRPDAIGLSESQEDRERTQLIIAKHRNGETADIDMKFKSERVKFVEPDEDLDIQAGMMDSAMNSDAYIPDNEAF